MKNVTRSPPSYTVEHFIRKADSAGNRYWAARITNKDSHKAYVGKVEHSSNLRMSLQQLGLTWANVEESEMEMPPRRWDALTKGWAGYSARELVEQMHEIPKTESEELGA